MMIKKLALATFVAMGMSAAAIAQQQPGQQPGQRSSEPPSSSQSPPAPRGGDRTAQVTFERADKNGDGRVSREEASDIDGFDFSRADTNDDRSLSRSEFQAAMAMATSTPREGPGARNDGSARSGDASPSTGSGQDERTAVSFATADKDKDGRVSRAEAADVPGLNFSAADTNDDSALSRQEFQLAMAGAQPRG